jgi:hypothetical protein
LPITGNKTKPLLIGHLALEALNMRREWHLALAWVLLGITVFGYPAADSSKILLGTWIGRAAGPQGGPPTGDITVIFSKAGAELKGSIQVLAPGGAQYSGEVSNIEVKKGIFSATAAFKFGENPLLAEVTGPVKGKAIAGTFAVLVKGQKMGDGTFSITKQAQAAPKTK